MVELPRELCWDIPRRLPTTAGDRRDSPGHPLAGLDRDAVQTPCDDVRGELRVPAALVELIEIHAPVQPLG